MTDQEKIKKLTESLEEVLQYLKLSHETDFIHAVYIPPAQAMRNAADALEKKEAVILAARQLLKQV